MTPASRAVRTNRLATWRCSTHCRDGRYTYRATRPRSAVGGRGRAYVRLSVEENAEAVTVTAGRMRIMRRGDDATVVAVGPLLAPTLDAVRGLEVTVLYATTVRPFDAETFLAVARPNVILVEPYLAGTSAATVSRLLAHRPHRLLALGVEQLELRRYGSPEIGRASVG